MTLAVGTKLGPYELIGSLGAGGMGEVYRARDTRLDRTVAIKVLPSALASDADRRARFQREAKTISQLNHLHICALYDVGEAVLPSAQRPSADTVQFLVMEHLEGETLAARLDRGSIPLDHAFRIATEMADALTCAHRHGIVHRDLKPSNVMLTKAGAKLLDFGLAKLRRPTPTSIETAAPTATVDTTGAGVLLGTLPYMAPEQLEGKEADARTDLWALGGSRCGGLSRPGSLPARWSGPAACDSCNGVEPSRPEQRR